MPYSTKEKPKVLRTHLTEDVHAQFRILCFELKITMSKLMEQMVIERLKKEAKKSK